MKTLRLILLVLILAPFCKQDTPFQYGANSMSALIDDVNKALNSNNIQNLTKLFLTKKEFGDSVYPYMPEALQQSPLLLDDYWLLLYVGIKKGIRNAFKDFKGCNIVSFTIHHTDTYGLVSIHKDILLTIKCDKNLLKNDEFMAGVVEKNNLFRLLSSRME